MLAGPLFSRELLTTSRSWKHYALRSGYLLLLFVLVYTAGQVVFGFQQVRLTGDVARFGQFVFGLLAITQLVLVATLSLLFASSIVSTEKDRRTLILLMMTDLSSRELVLGKMLGSLIGLVTIVAISAPAFALLRLFGGVTTGQILWFELICLSVGLLVAAWSTLVAYWREKTFQTLSIATLGAIGYLTTTGLLALVGGETVVGQIGGLLNPFVAVKRVLAPLQSGEQLATGAILASAGLMLAIAAGLVVLTCRKVRTWNPSRVVHLRQEDDGSTTPTAKPRSIWNRPVLWRETRTRAYGNKVFVIKGVFLALASLAFAYGLTAPAVGTGLLDPIGVAFVLLGLLSLVLANAQAVTSVTTERDGQTMELLLATEIPLSEFVLGKLVGTLWNAKELLLAPVLLIVIGAARGLIGTENAIFVLIAFAALVAFAVVLGLHFGLSYGQSRQAISGSLGSLLFLSLGIFICMLLIVEGRGSFALQFAPFLVFILGGAIALWTVLTHRRPSPALTVAAAVLPFGTFYALTGYLFGDTLAVAMFVVLAYGFTTVAMLIPALSDADFSMEAIRQ